MKNLTSGGFSMSQQHFDPGERQQQLDISERVEDSPTGAAPLASAPSKGRNKKVNDAPPSQPSLMRNLSRGHMSDGFSMQQQTQ